MIKEDFIKKFPDIKVQQFETDTILSKQEIMDIVEQATKSMDMGLVYYEHCGCNITVFTSDKMKAELAKMLPGYQVKDPNTGETGTIVSEKLLRCVIRLYLLQHISGNIFRLSCKGAELQSR